MENRTLRIPIALIVGGFFALFGVFIFSDFLYRGHDIYENIFSRFTNIDSGSQAFYQLLGSGFMVDWFSEFSSGAIATEGIWQIFFSERVWPAVLAWFMSGFFLGSILKGAKRGVIGALSLFAFIFVFWVVWGFFAGADMGNIFGAGIMITLGEIFTGIVWILAGSFLGGLASGPAMD